MSKYLKLSKYVAFIEKKLFGWQRIYSQCGEDLILEMMLNKANGFYVDVGGNDPRHFNNTYYFYKKGWRGINIEPNLSKLKQFRWRRPADLNLNFGIAEQAGQADFYSFKEDTLSTFSKEVSDEYQKMGHTLKAVEKVELLPLAEIFTKHLTAGQAIDFLTIDTEGYDLQVLKSNDWEKFRPGYVVLESLEYKKDGSGQKLNSTFEEYMNSVGYKIIADTYINSIFKDQQSKNLF